MAAAGSIVPRFELGYWKTRNLGEPARLMLAYANVKWKDTVYTQGNDKNPFDRSSWYSVKYKLGFDFPNLPYLIDNKNGLKLTESQAIYRYLARQLNIGCFDDALLEAKQDMMSEIVRQMYHANMDLTYGFMKQKEQNIPFEKKFSQATKVYLNDKLPTMLQPIENLLNKSKTKWLTNDQLCNADFLFWYTLDINLNLDLTCLDKFPMLKQYHRKFQKIPTIDNFFKTHAAANYPMNSKISAFGYTSDHNYTKKINCNWE